MHVIVAGCGRVGALLASAMDREGHTVTVIDRNRRAFERLDASYGGRTVQGIVFDRDTLEEAGVRKAQAFVAVTSGDNSNIVSARTARDRYGVERVVARIYDPQRAGIYERLGMTTVASARWTVEEIRRGILPEDTHVDVALGTGAGDVVVMALRVPQGVRGFAVAELAEPGRCAVAAITREGRTEVPQSGALVSSGDELHLAIARDAVDDVRKRVDALEGAEG